MEGTCKFSHFFGKLNPFSWSARFIRVASAAFFMIALPLYLFFGFQPTYDAGAAEYPSLNISSISLTTPVIPVKLNGRELEVPDRIAGSYSTTPSKVLLMGHSATVFKNLAKAQIGDVLDYDDQTYHITNIETLAKADISMSDVLAPADTPTLIIMTCAGTPLPGRDATHRLLVTATLL